MGLKTTRQDQVLLQSYTGPGQQLPSPECAEADGGSRPLITHLILVSLLHEVFNLGVDVVKVVGKNPVHDLARIKVTISIFVSLHHELVPLHVDPVRLLLLLVLAAFTPGVHIPWVTGKLPRFIHFQLIKVS